jgi:SHS2 domain-containing protein
MPVGHRTLPHPADVILQSWAPTAEGCLAEAVRALVECFADTSRARPWKTHEFEIADGPWDERLVSVLEEVLFLVDARGKIPIAVRMAIGGRSVSFELAGIDDVELVGSLPKGIARSGLEFGRVDDRWQARAIVDV